MHKYSHQMFCKKRQSNSDHVIKTVILTHVWCNITVSSNIVGTESSFSFNLFENPVSNCALFLNDSVVK